VKSRYHTTNADRNGRLAEAQGSCIIGIAGSSWPARVPASLTQA